MNIRSRNGMSSCSHEVSVLIALKLKQKIFFGFVTIGLIAVVTAAMAYTSFIYVGENLKGFIIHSDRAQLDLVLAGDVSEIQRKALIYTYEGHAGAAEQVEQLYKSMNEHMDKVAPSQNEYIEPIRAHLDAYMRAFTQLKKQRALQQTLVFEEFRAAATSAESNLREHISEQHDQSSLQEQLQDEQTFTALLMIEKDAIRYFDTLDPHYIVQTKQSFANFRSLMQQMKHVAITEKGARYMNQALTDVNEYERVFLEAVQRTRGYLFLVNVVMSAEAYEIVYHARQMSEQVRQEMQVIELDTLTLLKRSLMFVLAALLFSLLLIVTLTWWIGGSISNPIVRLTTAFRALAAGSQAADIPVYEVDDEIGQLTRAAAVFEEKNRQTEALLYQTRVMAEDLESSKRELERSNDELEQFVYTVSHDLKSPLVTSMGFIGIIKKLAAQGRLEEAVGKLDKVVVANSRMGQLINDLLELSRVGRINMDKQDVDLNQLLADFHEAHAQQLNEAGFSMQIEPGLPVIYANQSRILQLFENLLSNALKYAVNPQGSLLSIGSEESEQAYRIWFRDNGPGIPEAFHEKIFGLFYRLDVHSEGTGIGLAVAAKVMKFHNGTIGVDSRVGDGATFWMSFDKNVKEIPHG